MRYFLEIVTAVLLMTTYVWGKRQGDLCVVADQPGICRHMANCTRALKANLQGIRPQICGLHGTFPIVCCPLETNVEGSKCTIKNTGIAGICRPFANCRRAKEVASKGVLPQKCALTDEESELVCCAEADCLLLQKGLVTQLPIGSKAADYCIELAENIYPCQETNTGWARGDMCPQLTSDSNAEYYNTPMTTTAEAPHYGRIGTGEKGNINWPGYAVSLLSDRWVVCAARVIQWIGFEKVKFVGLGGSFTPQYTPNEIYDITRKHVHPLYNSGYSIAYNDIALLLLDRRVTFTNRILPACLHTGTPLPNSGFIFNTWEGSADRKTSMQGVSQDCSGIFPTGSAHHPAGLNNDTEICSRPVTPGGCPGFYYGSPLSLPNSPRVACTNLLVGLASDHNSPPCTITYTRISGFIPWIENIVWPESGIVV